MTIPAVAAADKAELELAPVAGVALVVEVIEVGVVVVVVTTSARQKHDSNAIQDKQVSCVHADQPVQFLPLFVGELKPLKHEQTRDAGADQSPVHSTLILACAGCGIIESINGMRVSSSQYLAYFRHCTYLLHKRISGEQSKTLKPDYVQSRHERR
jgi:hypothetical protein